MNRRTTLGLIAAAAVSPFVVACGKKGSAPVARDHELERTQPTPSLFIAHGAPPLLDDGPWVEQLATWGRVLTKPKAILMISAHWLDQPLTLGATKTVPLVYDFYGFPQRYYEVKYPAPGAPDLARRVRELVSPLQPVAEDPVRGLDHGAYVPLVAMYPEADVPVLQISIPTMDPQKLIDLGRALSPLRREGVMIVGSGFLTHNMSSIDFAGERAPPVWASEFDAWAGEVLGRRDVDAAATTASVRRA